MTSKIYEDLLKIIPKKYLKEIDGVLFLPNPSFDFQRMYELGLLSTLDKNDYDILFKSCNKLGILWQKMDYIPVKIISDIFDYHIDKNKINGKGLLNSFNQYLEDYFEITSKLENNDDFIPYDRGLRFNVHPDEMVINAWVDLIKNN